MVQICNYSSLIFTANVTVLLIVSMATDYWEYRGFDFVKIFRILSKTNRSKLVVPKDTKSYLRILYRYPVDGPRGNGGGPSYNVTVYQAPILVRKFYVNSSADGFSRRDQPHTCEIVVYVQYGNLFRNCEALEDEVRSRLGIRKGHSKRCSTFLFNRREAVIAKNIPAVLHLERAAFTCALVCAIAILTGLISGTYSSFSKSRRGLISSSATTLAAGMSLTFAIGLFHGKCHLLQRLELLPGHEVPFKKVINDARTYSYGWSFVLAWICVILCLIASFIWLYKAQNNGYYATQCRTNALKLRYRHTKLISQIYDS